ncbi:hypothetical protein U3516DRAFT_744684 [Neocallimastix sp. 'constans']
MSIFDIRLNTEYTWIMSVYFFSSMDFLILRVLGLSRKSHLKESILKGLYRCFIPKMVKWFKKIASKMPDLFNSPLKLNTSQLQNNKQKKVLTQASYLNHRTKRVVFAALTYIPQRMLTQYLNKTDSLHKKVLNHNLITHTILHSVAQKFSLQVYTTIPNCFFTNFLKLKSYGSFTILFDWISDRLSRLDTISLYSIFENYDRYYIVITSSCQMHSSTFIVNSGFHIFKNLIYLDYVSVFLFLYGFPHIKSSWLKDCIVASSLKCSPLELNTSQLQNIKLPSSTALITLCYEWIQKKVLTQASYLNHRTKRVVFAALTYILQRMLTQYLNKTDSLHKKVLNHNLITHTVLHSVAQKFSLQLKNKKEKVIDQSYYKKKVGFEQPDKEMSTTGFIYFMGSGPTSWYSKLQKCVATSTTEAEYYVKY